MNKPITLIIPHQNQRNALVSLLESITTWIILPDEIIIIDSSNQELECEENFKNFCIQKNISLNIIQEKSIFPGHARNLGIQSSKNDLIAFLDVQTVPTKSWLQTTLEQFNSSDAVFVRGATLYAANTFKEKIIVASTFGFNALKTLPGSLMHKEVFLKCGLFIDNVRAGEDGDWMSRTHLHKIPLVEGNEKITYIGLGKIGFRDIITKWYRNYKHTHHLPFFQKHKELYFYLVSILIIIAAQNWNWIAVAIAGGDVFIPHITKIIAFIIFISYFLVRVILLPVQKGAISQLTNPAFLIGVLLLSSFLDFAKIIAFANGAISKNR